jgi:hypothetical protein
VIREVVDIVTELVGLKIEHDRWICPLLFIIERERHQQLFGVLVASSQIFQELGLNTVLLVQFVFCSVTVHDDCSRHLLCRTWIGYVFKLNHFINF